MEAIDEIANENSVRSVAYTALEYRQLHDYRSLYSICSEPLRQFVNFVPPDTDTDDSDAWDLRFQLQTDDCPQMIESLWTHVGSVVDELYRKTVYYKRSDVDTFHAYIEFAEKDNQHFIVDLLLEEDGGIDIINAKYHNTKELTQKEWEDVCKKWFTTIENAERSFREKATAAKNEAAFTASTPDSASAKGKEAPEDYWDGWSSDEAESAPKVKNQRSHPLAADMKDSDESEDEYYTRWSKDPGTLTPGLDEQLPQKPKPEGRILQSYDAIQPEITLMNQDELDEEYDQSYNPLFTVPSIPNLMDAHTAALSELTQILQTSLPQQQTAQRQQQPARSRPFVQPMTQINPLSKAASRSKLREGNELVENDKKVIPGAYPESGNQTPITRKYSEGDLELLSSKEAGRGLFMKSLRALIGAAHLLGYEGNDILEMVQEIVSKK